MPETSTARAVVENKPTVVVNYQISDTALKSLRDSRHSIRHKGGIPNRHHSNGSNKSGTGTTTPPGAGGGALDNSRKSNRSSQTSSIWSNLMGRGRRIYGSAASVASSITLTEFDGNFSQEFEISDRSLDVRQFANHNDGDDPQAIDSQPTLPQRQTSVTAGQSSSMLSTASDLSAAARMNQLTSSHDAGSSSLDTHQHRATPPPPPGSPFRSSDLSPRQPGRKTSIKTLSSEALSAPSLVVEKEKTTTTATSNAPAPPFGRSNSKDSVPQFPCRKHSSKLMNESIREELQSSEFRDHASSFLEAVKPILTKYKLDEIEYDNTFSGAQAIDKMVESGMADSRSEAVEIARSLQESGELFHHLLDKEQLFADNQKDVFVLLPPPPPPPPCVPSPCLVSVRRQTDTSISIEEEAPLEEETAKAIAVPPVKR